MRKGKIFRVKVKNGVVNLGLVSLAVLFAAADTAGGFLVSFSDQRTSLNRALRNLEKYHPKSVSEYLEELREVSGLNLYNTIHRLEQKGLVANSKDGCRLTKLGREALTSAKQEIDYKMRWDGKWRLITFDVPEKRWRDRNWLRNLLKIHEYKPLHKSVFVGKYPLPENVYREIYRKKLAAHIRMLTIGEIDIDL